jgi:hypothetical protein
MGFTNNVNNTFPPSPLQPLYRIWRDWCIGDSLGYINDNFLYLETLINTLSTNMAQPPYNQKYQYISTATTNATLVVAGPATVGSIYFSTDGSVTVPVPTAGISNIFLKIYDKASAPIVGTDVPILTLAGTGYSEYSSAVNVLEPTGGIRFTNGIAFAITQNPGPTDTTAVYANQGIVNIIYN